MKEEILKFYLKTSMYTNWGPYKEYYKSLPDDLETLTELLLSQTIHRQELIRDTIVFNETGKSLDNIAVNYPWWRYRSHDDILLTAPAIMAELNRLDDRGIFLERDIDKKVVITCRYVAIWLASILKAKGIPTRVRSGFASYFSKDEKYYDHWIIEYYNYKENRWIICDPDSDSGKNHTDMKKEDFGWIAKIWLDVRSGKANVNNYIHGTSFKGLDILAYTLFFDFHALMNDEISYLFFPTYIDNNKEFFDLSKEELKELDDLATLMLDPDKNFSELLYIFRNDKKIRRLNTPLLSDYDHQESDITYKILNKNNIEEIENLKEIILINQKSMFYLNESINIDNPNIKYYLAYFNHNLIGVTGFYELAEYPDDLFVGKIGILSNYQDNGLKKRLFLDTLNMAYQHSKKYLRIIVNNKIHLEFDNLCKKYMDIVEEYNKETVIYSKNLSKGTFKPWNKRFLNLENE